MHNCYNNTSILSPVAEPALLTLQNKQKTTKNKKLSLWNSVLRQAPCVYLAQPPQKHTKPVK